MCDIVRRQSYLEAAYAFVDKTIGLCLFG